MGGRGHGIGKVGGCEQEQEQEQERGRGLLVCWSVGLLVCWSVGLLASYQQVNLYPKLTVNRAFLLLVAF